MGVALQAVMGRHIADALGVPLNGTACTRMTSLPLQNCCNSVGMRTVPSRFKVLVVALRMAPRELGPRAVLRP